MNKVQAKRNRPLGRLRILATTDLHMHLSGYDYIADQNTACTGLIGLAGTIAALRAEDGVATLLLDNGDVLQGNPLADHVAETLETGQQHPMVAAMQTLGYDAMTLGNHDFDYGLRVLARAFGKPSFPIVSANIAAQMAALPLRRYCILTRHLPCSDGASRPIRIGITGFAPPQIAAWAARSGDPALATTDIIAAAQDVIPRMRAAGADVIIALSHAGIGAADHHPRMENATIPLAAVPGIDAIIAGHTHELFPQTGRDDPAGVDSENGTIHGTPVVQPGAFGAALGVIDLDLVQNASGWAVTGQSVRLALPDEGQANEATTAMIRDIAEPHHQATLAHMRAPVTRTTQLIDTSFATVVPDLLQQILSDALRSHAAKALRGTDADDLPLLVATAPYFAAMRGPRLRIPPGPLTRVEAFGIFPFADPAVIVHRTGAELRAWLERSAAHYAQIDKGRGDCPLFAPRHAAYHCDTLHGLTYQIDLCQPAAFDRHGTQTSAIPSRITELRHDGRPVRDDDLFAVATSQFRAAGGGGFAKVPEREVLHTSARKLQAILLDHLAATPDVAAPVRPVWRFAPCPGSAGVFTAPSAAGASLPDGISWIADSEDGMARYRISL